MFALMALAAGLLGLDVMTDRDYRLEVVSDEPLLQLPPTDYPEENPAKVVLKAGDKIRVLRMRYGKDFQAFRVETANGAEGWVIAGRGVKVVSRG